MRTRFAIALVLAIATSGANAQDTRHDVARLISELGAQADEDLVRDLADPDLLPSSGNHRAQFIWNASRVSPRGALAMIVPPAVRVGRTLLDLRAQGIQFTDSVTVRRILNATEMWDRFRVSPAYQLGWKAATESVDRSELHPGQAVTFTNTAVSEQLVVSELSGPAPASIAPWPGPGELYCCLRFNIYSIPGGFECLDAGTACEICVRCGGGRSPVWPGPKKLTAP